ncbi:hypothetical protein DH2020_033758 [Rehmannia glutinosa]|uniref:Uncharacterized protein n=1 Tax=Rehmannia glutinosa TaxID=99300 RepID=A0ABR0VB94_REHGL
MVYLGSLESLYACKDAAGIAGNFFAFGLFLSPVNESTEQFSGLPYIYALLNCLITAWYGLPMISSDNILVTTVNSSGALFQIVYVAIFIKYAEKTKKWKMVGLLMSVIIVFAIIALGSLLIVDFEVPNGIGAVLGVIQLFLFLYYKKSLRDDSTEPLIVSYSCTDA